MLQFPGERHADIQDALVSSEKQKDKTTCKLLRCSNLLQFGDKNCVGISHYLRESDDEASWEQGMLGTPYPVMEKGSMGARF